MVKLLGIFSKLLTSLKLELYKHCLYHFRYERQPSARSFQPRLENIVVHKKEVKKLVGLT